jgi:carbon monoxide dehydrogenase subunit G
MNSHVDIRLELSIPQERVIHQLRLHNQEVEKQIEIGVKNAIEKLCNGTTIAIEVEKTVTEELLNMARKTKLSWQFEQAIQKRVQEKFSERVDEVVDKMLASIVKETKQS